MTNPVHISKFFFDKKNCTFIVALVKFKIDPSTRTVRLEKYNIYVMDEVIFNFLN